MSVGRPALTAVYPIQQNKRPADEGEILFKHL